MIKIDRAAVSVPRDLIGSTAKQQHAAATRFFNVPHSERRQRRFPLDLRFAMATVAPALERLFNGKCAYCEKKLVQYRSFPNFDHFRPTGAAVGADGEISIDHYWWLAYEWRNLFSCCLECNRAKSNHFPIQGARAKTGTPWEKLGSEKPVLIDPTADEPAHHLLFSTDGRVAGRTLRGKQTIALLNLNRSELVNMRRQESERFLEIVKEVAIPQLGAQDPNSSELVNAALPFAALKRQLLHEKLSTHRGKAVKRSIGKVLEEQELDESRRELASVETRVVDKVLYEGTRYIRKVEIHNFYALKNVTIVINAETSAGAPWTVLLGDNGVGKSSVLKAIALTLGGDSYREHLGIKPKDLLKKGCSEGFVRVSVDGLKSPIELSYSSSKAVFDSNSPEAKLLILAYGATRLLPIKKHRAFKQKRYARLNNLFDPFFPLIDATKWLKSLSDEQFDFVARALRELLEIPHEAEVHRAPKGVTSVRLRRNDDFVPINRMSDGYQSMLALGTDMISVLSLVWTVMEAAQGVVLLDELGTHLHPTWRMKIVSRLRSTFPKVQFIASTHDPLCLRGLSDGEVALLRKSRTNELQVVQDLPSIQGLRVDQILTSSYFGLHSTIDPAVEEQFGEYYELLAKHEPTKVDIQRIEALRRELAQYEILGTTRRERIMYKAIDKFLALEPEVVDPIQSEQLPVELTALFEEVVALAARGGSRS